MENPVVIKKEKVDTVTSTTFTPEPEPEPQFKVRVKQEIITLSSDESNVDDGQKNVAAISQSETLKTPAIVKEEKVENVEIPTEKPLKLNELSPSTFKVQLVRKHPDTIVENASLASVCLPDSYYKLSLPEEIIDSGALSAVQLEPIIHACQRHKLRLPDGSRAGFLVGDGAGLGKGRIAAGVIVENYTLGRKKSVWISDSDDLQYDVERDLRDIGAEKIPVYSLNKFDSIMLDSEQPGVLFSTYWSLVEEVRSSSGKCQTRLAQLFKWCGGHFDGVIILDECHHAKNLFYSDLKSESAIELALLDLHNELPNARIVYICATGVSEPRNLGYMNRLGLWGRGTSFKASRSFIDIVETAGSMEMVGMEMKQRGMYLSRQLSFKDVIFKGVEASLTLKSIQVYDNSVKLWDQLRESLTKATDLANSNQFVRKRLWSHYWSSHQNYFKYLSISVKVMRAVKLAQKALKNGKCVVIGVQSTGVAYTLEQIDKEGADGLSDFVSTTKNVLRSLVEKHFPVSGYYDGSIGGKRKSFYVEGGEIKRKRIESFEDEASHSETEVLSEEADNNRESLSSIKNQLLAQIEKLGTVLPRNWIDELIHELGGPQNVAEISNRKGRVVQKDNGQILYESRSETDIPLEMINIRERERFMNGEKNIAIVTKAAINGISLNADRRVNNQRRRVFISLECPSSIHLLIQQFGCTHRSNQVSAPEFVILFSELAAERRFASIVAKHFESFGATNCGDRRVFEDIDPSEFTIENKHGSLALESTMRSVLGYKDPVVSPPVDYQGEFFKDVTKALISVGLIRKCVLEISWKASAHPPPYTTLISKFINRILGIPVELQTRLYKYFTETLSMTIRYAKMRSDFSAMGIVDLGVGHNIRRTKLTKFTIDIPTGKVKIELNRFEIDRGMTWETALAKWNSVTGANNNEGFYMSSKFPSGKCSVSLIKQNDVPISSDQKELSYTVFRPNTDPKIILPETVTNSRKFRKVIPFVAQPHWNDLYLASQTDCFHSYLHGRCSKTTIGIECQDGLRMRTYNVLCGPVLSIWKEVESILYHAKEMIQIVRVHVGSQRKVGLVIPSNCETSIVNLLTKNL